MYVLGSVYGCMFVFLMGAHAPSVGHDDTLSMCALCSDGLPDKAQIGLLASDVPSHLGDFYLWVSEKPCAPCYCVRNLRRGARQ